jgi:putative Mn2+ efflux pump MntP
MTSTSLAARLLLRIGVALLVLSILCRLVGRAAPGQIGADLAIAASLVLIVVSSAALRFRRPPPSRQ